VLATSLKVLCNLNECSIRGCVFILSLAFLVLYYLVFSQLIWIFYSEVWGPVTHTHSQVLRFGGQKYILGKQNFVYYMFKTIFFWAQHNLDATKIFGVALPPNSPRGYGLMTWQLYFK